MTFLDIDPAVPITISVVGTLATLVVGLLAFRQRDNELRDKADESYVNRLERRVDRAEGEETKLQHRLEKAEFMLAACQEAKEAMELRLDLLETERSKQ